MIAMIELTTAQARIVFSDFNKEVFELLDNGAESLVERETQIEDDRQYGIEGEVFGEPYHIADKLVQIQAWLPPEAEMTTAESEISMLVSEIQKIIKGEE